MNRLFPNTQYVTGDAQVYCDNELPLGFPHTCEVCTFGIFPSSCDACEIYSKQVVFVFGFFFSSRGIKM